MKAASPVGLARMVNQTHNVVDRFVKAHVFASLYCLPNMVHGLQAGVVIDGGGRQAGHSPDVIVCGVAGTFRLLLKGFQSPQDFCLHDQHGFQHFLSFVFSHVVFLLWVGGVATATLAGYGVAFYSRGAP